MKTLGSRKKVDPYNVANWSEDYFEINSKGELVVKLDEYSFALSNIVDKAISQGLRLPLLLRFNDILKDRVKNLNNAFAKAIEDCSYTGSYNCVFPIKVNQQKRVVENLYSASESIGLEAGSKPELLAILAITSSDKAVIICNGYKDREFVRTALLAQKLGNKVFIIVEKICELHLILAESEKMNITPNIGARVRLSSIGKGNWQNTGGEKSKFGLSAPQMWEMIEILKERNRLNELVLLHSHLGSQIANLQDVQRGVKESVRYYVELLGLGVPIKYLDLGGGLGIDYEGSKAKRACSVTYTTYEYAHTVIKVLTETCAESKVIHPNVITESGRALTAHHSVLITNTIDNERVLSEKLLAPNKNSHSIIKLLQDDLDTVCDSSVVEVYNEAVYNLEESKILFNQGFLSLHDKALIEQLFFQICIKVKKNLNPEYQFHREILRQLNEKLSSKLFCNFSVFQSLPDVWALEQLFPILTLNNLHSAEKERVVLQDITCDSDGVISNYAYKQSIETSLPLPKIENNKDGLIGIFLIGAYQEILGDMHNLFGDTDLVEVISDSKGDYSLVNSIEGSKVIDVLEYVNYNKDYLLSSYKLLISESGLQTIEKEQYLNFLVEALEGYTYLED